MELTPKQTRNFWKKVVKTDGCWEWTGAKSVGYGRVRLDGRTQWAHRISYVIAHGPIPDGLILLHSCDNPSCVNPDHLRPGTNRDNSQDALQKGRWHSKLTASQVLAIREQGCGGIAIKVLADLYRVSTPTIRRVITHRIWRHVGGPVTSFTRVPRAEKTPKPKIRTDLKIPAPEPIDPILQQSKCIHAAFNLGVRSKTLARLYGLTPTQVCRIVDRFERQYTTSAERMKGVAALKKAGA